MTSAARARVIKMREACSCGEVMGHVIRRGLQDTVRCTLCDKFQYNAPRTETGEKPVSLQSTHEAIRPKQRIRILERANRRCEVCGAEGLLTVGHIISVKAGLQFGMEPDELNDDENLTCLCAECNTGMGAEPMPLRLAISILRARLAWAEEGE